MVRTRPLIAAICLSLLSTALVWAQDPPPQAEPAAEFDTAQPPSPAEGDELSVDQARLADRFKRLEEVLGQLAEFSASSDPRRAKLLREAIAQSREEDINVRFEAIVKLLEDERLSAATNNQKELQQELETLLNLLLKADRDKELASQRDRVRQYLKEVVRLLRMQKGVRARTEGGDEFGSLKDDQQKISADTQKLGGEITDNEREKRNSENADAGSSDPNKSEGDKPGSSSESDKGKGDKPESDGDESKKGDGSQEGEQSESGKSSKSGKPNEGDSGKSQDKQSGKGEPSEGQSGEPSDTPPSESGQPSDSNPSQGQQGQPSPGEAEPSEQHPPSQEPTERAAERLRRAAEQMENAREKLEEAEREGAADRQREAMRELELAKADLERVLRQLREEELERTLTQLVARFRKMLEWQNQVYEGTVRLNEVPQAKRGHDNEIEAARLSRQESDIVREADKALLLLREEGSSVAFPEIIEQMREDMRSVVDRLTEFKVGAVTQGLEQDIIAALEETIAALEQARKDLEKKRTSPGGQQAGGQPGDPKLVDEIAELKLIRSLQMRVNKRTQRYGEMIEGEQAETAELIEALKELSDRQQRVQKATSDLQQGLND